MKQLPSKSWETWIGELIQEAQQAGELEQLEAGLDAIWADAILAECCTRRSGA